MKYLVAVKPSWKRKKSHLWDGKDTLCRLYSTGGIAGEKYMLSDSPREAGICQLCRTKHPELENTVPLHNNHTKQ